MIKFYKGMRRPNILIIGGKSLMAAIYLMLKKVKIRKKEAKPLSGNGCKGAGPYRIIL
jgi:hypothetical protein